MSLATVIGLLVLAIVGTPLLGLLSKWLDRKVTARIQWRVGPPWYQTIADFLKLLGKETLIPETARRTGFLMAPVFGLSALFLAAFILWSANIYPKVAFLGDLIVVYYLLLIPSIAVIWGGASSGSPIGAMGASREMKLILAYELPLVLALLVPAIKAGFTFRLSDIQAYQSSEGIFLWSISGVIAFVVALLAVQAKLGLIPFDIAEAEGEIMTGPYAEYSGAPLAMFYLSRASLVAVLIILLGTVFLGGFSFTGFSILWSAIKYGAVLVVMVLIRNTNPRLRIDQALKLFWFGLAPLAALAVILAIFNL